MKENKMSIQERMSQIQRELKAPKGQYNAFGKYNYRSCEDILDAVKKLLETGEFVNMEDEIMLIGDRFYVKATAHFCLGEQRISSSAYAREPLNKKGMDESQITGATSSYARKYALNGLFAIDDNKDADATNKHDKEANKNVGTGGGGSAFGPSEKQIKFIRDLNSKHGVMTNEQINNIKTSQDAKAIIDKLMTKGK